MISTISFPLSRNACSYIDRIGRAPNRPDNRPREVLRSKLLFSRLLLSSPSVHGLAPARASVLSLDWIDL
uniref:Uncharacterized protein n=1 Tax=Picea glauca TaxID=3330 RepID=A0A101M2L4_PICGL|nr:hypothetical protein ABT39_MTgene3113 [Picea glauca]QHR86471.1 hypothetical protein Q903MT_gene471 [Picea sitchensis]